MKITKNKTFKEVAFWIILVCLFTLSTNMMNALDDLVVFGGFIILVFIIISAIHKMLEYVNDVIKKTDSNKSGDDAK